MRRAYLRLRHADRASRIPLDGLRRLVFAVVLYAAAVMTSAARKGRREGRVIATGT
ncbi:MAG: hypothetical protein ACJ8ER_17465 [Allosphingosinicella sp.]